MKSKRFSEKKITLISLAGVILAVFVIHTIVTRDIATIDDSDIFIPSKVTNSDLDIRDLILGEDVLGDIKRVIQMAKSSPPIDQELLSSLIAKCQKDFVLFDQFVESADWKIEGEIQINSSHPEIYSLRALALVRELELKRLWDNGENEKALKKAVSLLKLGGNLQKAEGGPLHHLVGLSLVKMGQTDIARFIQEQRLSDDQLKSLFTDIKATSFDSVGFQKTLAVDYNSQKTLINDLAAGKIDFEYMSNGGNTTKPNPKRPNPLFFKKNKTIELYAEGYRNLIAEAPLFPANAPNAAERQAIEIRVHLVKTYLSGNPVGRLLFSLTIPAISGVQATNRITQTQHDLLRLQIAAELYRLENGKLPPSLAALVPEFIDSIPVDLMDGQPLRYNPETLRIYSIGRDLSDANGDVRQNRTAPFQDSNEPMIELEWPEPPLVPPKRQTTKWDIEK